jgi:hypothetical protein
MKRKAGKEPEVGSKKRNELDSVEFENWESHLASMFQKICPFSKCKVVGVTPDRAVVLCRMVILAVLSTFFVFPMVILAILLTFFLIMTISWKVCRKLRYYTILRNNEMGFENCLKQLRRKLKLTQEGGFALSNEPQRYSRRFLSSRKLIVIPKRHMESATRLWRLEEFDIGDFNALCAVVADSCDYGVTNHDNLELIRTWLLDVAVSVLKDIQKISSQSAEDFGSDEIVIIHFASFSSSNLPKTFHGNRRALETYFRGKIMAVQLWQANSCALFKDFQIPVEEMMANLTEDCHKRFKAIKNEPRGKEMCSFRWNPQRGEFSCENCELDTDKDMRQDDEHVQAVRWNERDVVEQAYENSSQHLKRGCTSGLRIINTDESVFVGQLHRSAWLLDRAFKRTVTDILSTTSDHICTGDPEIMSATPSLNMHYDTVINFNPMDAEDHDFASWLNPRVDDNLISQHYDEKVKIQYDARSEAIPTPSFKAISAVEPKECKESTGCVTIRIRLGLSNLAEARRSEDGDRAKELQAEFMVNVYFGPIKTQERMKEKLHEYCFPHPWSTPPLTANIRDPIRLAIACDNPSQILQLVRFFLSSQSSTGLKVVRVKNKFSQKDENARKDFKGLDLTLNVLFEEPASGLKIIGEIQLHDERIHEVLSRIHKLYKIKRAHNPATIA